MLGCGVDVAYPRTHADLLREIAGQGVLLSEYPLGTRPEGFRFPARNRIISRLVQGVVVVEATEKSGSLITARLALDQGRRCSPCPAASIRRKARARTAHPAGRPPGADGADILDELSWDHRLVASTPAQAALPGPRSTPAPVAARQPWTPMPATSIPWSAGPVCRWARSTPSCCSWNSAALSASCPANSTNGFPPPEARNGPASCLQSGVFPVSCGPCGGSGPPRPPSPGCRAQPLPRTVLCVP